jgi:hypothetical protein
MATSSRPSIILSEFLDTSKKPMLGLSSSKCVLWKRGPPYRCSATRRALAFGTNFIQCIHGVLPVNPESLARLDITNQRRKQQGVLLIQKSTSMDAGQTVTMDRGKIWRPSTTSGVWWKDWPLPCYACNPQGQGGEREEKKEDRRPCRNKSTGGEGQTSTYRLEHNESLRLNTREDPRTTVTCVQMERRKPIHGG